MPPKPHTVEDAIAKALAVLQDVQFITVEYGDDGEEPVTACPSCGLVDWKGHTIDCPLMAAIEALKDSKPSRARTVEIRNIITVSEILKLAGQARQPIPRSTLQRWRDRHEFPKPLKTVGRRTELWDAVEVRAWLEVWRQRGE